jgi:putative methionine-R-sulfoxide reductase with GAF domain
MLNSTAPDLTVELDKVALELFSAVEERLTTSNSATMANSKVLESMRLSSVRLNEMDNSIRNLQISYSKSFATALEKTSVLSAKLDSIEALRNLVRELQLVTLTVQNSQNSSTNLIAKGKLRAIRGRITNNEYYKANPNIASIIVSFSDKLAEYIKIQSVAIAQKDGDSKRQVAEFGKDISYKLNDLFQTLDQNTMLARDELTLASSKQEDIYKQSQNANRIIVTDSELVALGLMVTGDTNRLFTVETVADLVKLDTEIRNLFTKINAQVHTLESTLTSLNRSNELKTLHSASASLASIHTEIYAPDGIITKLTKKLKAVEQAEIASNKLHSIVARQSNQGKESISNAQTEQENSITAVNSMIKLSLSQISIFATMAISLSIMFGFWIYRSIVKPLGVMLKTVRLHEKQVKEKSLIAEAVAGGNLDVPVTIGSPVSLDSIDIKKDEVGNVLNAIVAMSVAQITMDKAFANMTHALRATRDKDMQHNRLKAGLYELNMILRNAENQKEMADNSLAFVAEYLDAGVGIMYRYNDLAEHLHVLSTYAISSLKPLDEGIELGEGLVGQVASEKKMICLTTVPPEYLSITSALGKADPLNVAILPIMHNDTLAGVLELGSFRQFNSDDFEFLTQALDGIAIAINVNRSRELVNELLEQTQTQAEELRVQQEELQQTNEELLERARMLGEVRKAEFT